MKIYLDIDDVIFSWFEAYAKRFNARVPKSWVDSPLVWKRLAQLKKEKEFWLNLPIKHVPNFRPSGFVSARSVNKTWTKESLKKNNIPGRSNVFQVPWGMSKLEVLKSLGCTIFVDDKVQTFRELNKAGMFCLLMDAAHNQKVKTKYRIHSLDIEEIMKKYESLCRH